MSKLRRLTILLVIVIAGFAAVSVTMLIEMRREIWVQDLLASRNLITAEADDIGRTVAIYALSLRGSRALLFDPDIAHASPHLQQLALFDQRATAAYLGPVRIIDPDGQVLHDSASLSPALATSAEREVLDRHRVVPDGDLFISKPSRDDPQGDLAVSLSYRITAPDGHFAGIVIGTIQLAYFNGLFQRLRLGPNDVVSLFQTDGMMLAHAPDGVHVGQTIRGSAAQRHFAMERSGSFVARSVFSGTRRVYTFTHVDGWPLVLDVGLSTQDLYAPWRHRAWLTALLLVIMGLMGGALLLTLRRELQLRVAAEQMARANEARYRLLANNASDVILRFDKQFTRTYVSPSCRMFGYEAAELLGGTPKDWVHPEDWHQVLTIIRAAQLDLANTEATYRIRHKQGHYVWVEGRYSYVPEDGGFITVLRDIDRRKEAETRLEEANATLRRLAAVDGLTGLANRRGFDERLDEEWRRAARGDSNLAILLIDVDHFKSFNDRFGHQAGDTVLQAVAAAVQSAIRRPGDSAARYGGEEFIVILPQTDLYGAIEVGEMVRRAVLELPLPQEDEHIRHVSVSIGATAARPGLPGASPETLIGLADEALYDAKRDGRNQVKARLAQQHVLDLSAQNYPADRLP